MRCSMIQPSQVSCQSRYMPPLIPDTVEFAFAEPRPRTYVARCDTISGPAARTVGVVAPTIARIENATQEPRKVRMRTFSEFELDGRVGGELPAASVGIMALNPRRGYGFPTARKLYSSSRS